MRKYVKKLVASSLVTGLVLSGMPQVVFANSSASMFSIPQGMESVLSSFDKNQDQMLSQEEREQVTVISCPDGGITGEIDLSSFPNLQYINLAGNKITKINISGLTKLQKLCLENNNLQELDITTNTGLEVLSVYNNYHLTALNTTNNAKLKYLSINDTRITSIDLSKCSGLEALFAGYNPSLQSITYPANPLNGVSLSIDPEDLYGQDQGAKGTHIEWVLEKNGQKIPLTMQMNKESVYGYTAKATWVKNSYTVTYQLPTGMKWADGKESVAVKNGTYGDVLTLPTEQDFVLDKGYEWKGWTTSAGTITGNQLQVSSDKDKIAVVVAPSITKIPEVKPTEAKVVFEKGGDDVVGMMVDTTTPTNKTFYFPKCQFTRDGYTFAGWKLQSNGYVYKAGGFVRVSDSGEPLVLVAQWKENKGTIVIGLKEVTGAVSHTLTNEDLAPIQKLGYQFSHWTLDGKKVQEGETLVFYNDGERITLMPKWTPNHYFVEYYSEDGQLLEKTTFTYDEYVAGKVLEDKEDQLFVGWKHRNDELTVIYYKGRDFINLSTEDGATVQLQAVYKDKTRQLVVEPIENQVYTGSEITVETKVSVLSGSAVVQLQENVDYIVKYEENKNVGTALVTIQPVAQEKYEPVETSFHIVKGTMNHLVQAVGYEGEFDGNAYSIEVKGVPDNSVVRYRIAGEDRWSTVKPQVTIGEMTVQYEVSNPNYESVSGSEQVVIKEKKVVEEEKEETKPSVPTTPNVPNVSGGGMVIAPAPSSSQNTEISDKTDKNTEVDKKEETKKETAKKTTKKQTTDKKKATKKATKKQVTAKKKATKKATKKQATAKKKTTKKATKKQVATKKKATKKEAKKQVTAKKKATKKTSKKQTTIKK